MRPQVHRIQFHDLGQVSYGLIIGLMVVENFTSLQIQGGIIRSLANGLCQCINSRIAGHAHAFICRVTFFALAQEKYRQEKQADL